MEQSFEASLPEELHQSIVDMFSQYSHAKLSDKGLEVIPIDGEGLKLRFSKGSIGKLRVEVLENPKNTNLEYIRGRIDSDMKYAIMIAKEQRSR